MTMCKRRCLPGIFFFASALLLFGCAKDDSQVKQFIISSNEEGVICSAKSTFNDTLFYENRFPDSTLYYYAVLTQKQNQKLRQLIQKLKAEKTVPKFELHPGGPAFVVESDDVRFYEESYTLPSSNTKNILTLITEVSHKMEDYKKVEDFWNIDGVAAPESPIE